MYFIPKNNRFAIKLIYESSKNLLFSIILLSILGSFLPAGMLYCIKLIIDNISTANKENIFLYTILAGIFYVTSSIITSIHTVLKEKLTQKLTDHINIKIQTQLSKLPYSFFESSKYQNLYQRAVSEAYFRPAQVLDSLIAIFQNTLAIIIFSGIIITLQWFSAIVLLLASLPEAFIKVSFSTIFYNWYKNKSQEERKITYFHNILTKKDFVKEIRLFNLYQYFQNLYKLAKYQYYREKNYILEKKLLFDIIFQIISALLIFSLFGYMILQTIKGEMSTGSIVLFFMALQRGLLHLRNLLNGIAGLYESNLFLNELYEFFNLKNSDFHKSNNFVAFPDEIEKIVFKNLYFSYPEKNIIILNNINLTINKGETIAIVGHNGAGKTTLIKLLLGFYTPTSGNIYINGIPIDKFSQETILANIGVIFQDFILFNTTVAENIYFGDINRTFDIDKIKEAASKANIVDLIERLPLKYNTLLGTLFENSYELSSGEWQKLALARIFYKKSKLVILDEPTTNVDAESEFNFYNNFRNNSKNLTAIIISHRFNTVKSADKIFVMKDGTIVEEGNHNELMQLNGIYSKLFKLQSQSYLD